MQVVERGVLDLLQAVTGVGGAFDANCHILFVLGDHDSAVFVGVFVCACES